MRCILSRLLRTAHLIDTRKLICFDQPVRPVKVLTAFKRIKSIRTMSTSDQLKRDGEFDVCPSEKRVKTEMEVPDVKAGDAKADVGDVAAGDVETNDVEAGAQVDLNDYRNFRIKEENVGIVEFVSANKGFKCELKQRFSDFIVHEIASNGDVIELTSVEVPSMSVEIKEAVQDAEIAELIPDEMKERLLQFDEQTEVTGEPILIDVHEKDKTQRTKMHKFISRFKSLESKTQELDGRRHIKVIKVVKGSQKGRDAKVDSWPEGLPIYLHFNFYQENKGTTEALADLAKKLRINVKNIGYAGLKDKRAISTQQCSLYKVRPAKLLEFNKRASTYKFPSFAGNFRFRDAPIFLGDAIGNRFQLVLRDVVCENEADIDSAIENIKTNGYINYFGIQRFGHSEFPSHRIGIAIIRKQYKEAIDLILRYRQKDLEPAPFSKLKKTFNECLRIYREDKDAGQAYREFFWKTTNEGLLLKGLSMHGTNYFNAFSEIPRNSRSFYCHAFQSYIFNWIASYRMRTYGLKLAEGDLVIRKKQRLDEAGKETADEPADAPNGESNGESKGEPNGASGEKGKTAKSERQKLNYIRDFENEDVIVLDDSNMADYTIFDVVLPLVGPEARYPENSVKGEIQRLLLECGVSDEHMRSVGDIFYVRGSYRRFLAKPVDLKHEIVHYETNTVRLFDTDFDRFNQVNHNVKNEGTNTAVKIEFSLPSCTYATVMIRELSRQNV